MLKFRKAELKKDVNRIRKGIIRHWQLYLLVLAPITYLVIFKYIPLIGSVIAFKDYSFVKGVFGSDWVGLKHFIRFFKSPQFKTLMLNTIGLSLYQIIAGVAPPILLAIALNYVRSKIFGKTVQMVTYMPYFISTVLVVGILSQILSLGGPVNQIIKAMGVEPVHFMGDPKLFRTIYVFSGIWQNNGYNAVIYLAALAAISPELYEAAIIDGASIWKRIYYIDIPSILPTAVILLILACGRILSIGYEKVLLMQNNLNLQTSDIISTYVYRVGLISMQYSYSTAIGLFQSVVSFILLVLVNKVSRSLNETSLW
ncbi:MAG: sugar ABC transporter permease [Clostridiaceae bacterium]|nr:sugar ABC transporter permease [Clostridiaceae bacterium]